MARGGHAGAPHPPAEAAHPWLARLRLDDLFALGAIVTFTLLSLWASPTLLNANVLGFVALLGYYGIVAGLTRWVGGRPDVPASLQRAGLLAATAALFAFTVLAPEGPVDLGSVQAFVVLAFPLLAVALTPSAQGAAQDAPSGMARGARLARDWGPYLVSGALYLSLHDVVSQVNPIDRDSWLIGADLALFGAHASVWMQRFISPALTEWLSMCYALYALFPVTLGALLLLRGDRARFQHLMQASILVSWLGFMGYLLVPAIGPMYTLAPLYDVPLQGGPLYAMKQGLDTLRIPRDCFPSLHTAHTVVVLVGALMHSRRIGLIYLPLCLSCIAATLYLRYHYAADVLAGLVLACFCLWVTPKLSRSWQRWVRGAA